MIHSTATIDSPSGQTLFTQTWLPGSEVRAVLIIVHGLTEHSGRYMPLVEYFVRRGFAVYALDHEGHGRSGGQRAHVDRFSTFVESLGKLISTAQNEQAGKKITLVGHSMGGVITLNYLLNHQENVSACILSGAALSLRDVIGPGPTLILKLLSALLPNKPLIKIEGEAVSKDFEVVKSYENDPLVFRGKATARLLAEILRAANTALKKASDITLPILILHGGDDRLASPDGSVSLNESVSSKDKTLRIYESLYHEIFLEKEKYEVYSDMENWLGSRI